MRIIGLTGAAASGKDTAAKFAIEWCDEHDLLGARFAFADALKRSSAACFGIAPYEAVEWCNNLKHVGFVSVQWANERGVFSKEFSGRQFLQRYGTEAHRDVFGPDFWVNALELELREADGACDVVFISDVRFENEQKMIYRYGGDLWHINRPNTAKVEQHASEAGLETMHGDAVICNAGDLDDLRVMVNLLCEERLKEAN